MTEVSEMVAVKTIGVAIPAEAVETEVPAVPIVAAGAEMLAAPSAINTAGKRAGDENFDI
jgi:hypothetical protein